MQIPFLATTAPIRTSATLCWLALCAVMSTWNIIFSSTATTGSSSLRKSKGMTSEEEQHQQHKHQNNNNKPLCTRKEIQQGYWEPIQLDKPPYIPEGEWSLRTCKAIVDFNNTSSSASSSADRASPFSTYQYTAGEDCEFTQWDKETFFNVMGKNEVILFRGDSLMQEQYNSFVSLLGMTNESVPYHFNGHAVAKNACGSRGGKNVSIHFVRDDALYPFRFDKELRKLQPSIVVLNRGAHYVEDQIVQKRLDGIIQSVQSWQKQCRKKSKSDKNNCLLIWRTTVPGHPNCGNYSTPLNNLTFVEEDIIKKGVSQREINEFHWPDYRHQNEMVLDMLNRSDDLEYEIMDAYHMNMKRPDEHHHSKDCLHSCSGSSKLDSLGQLLLHILRMRQQNEKVFDP